MKKLKLDLPLVLPSVVSDHDACIERLKYALVTNRGISEVHVENMNGKKSLCIHYNPDLLKVERVREIVLANGARLEDRFGHISERIKGALDARKARRIEADLGEINGVLESSVSVSGSVHVEFDKETVSSEVVHSAVRNIITDGRRLKVLSENSSEHDQKHDHAKQDHNHDHGSGLFGQYIELLFAVLATVFLIAGYAMERSGATGVILQVIYGASYFFGGFFTVKEAIETLKSRKLEIDSLMIVAAIGAASLGELAEGALLLALFSLGHALEHFAMERARKAVEALSELVPETARVRRDGKEIEVRVEEIGVNELLLVKPNERIASDGFVVKGESSVDQSSITGESVPVEKFPLPAGAAGKDRERAAHKVFSGTINGAGHLEIQVTKVASDSTLARVVQMVNDAESKKSPTQVFTDKFERLFVPIVLVFVAVLPFAFVIVNETLQESLYRAMAVLVAASPCALAIATPSAVLSALGRAARGGVLIKGGAPLEELGTISAIAFDKTGTLTEGKPRVTEVKTMEGVSTQDLLSVLAAIERQSDHPLAAAIVSYVDQAADQIPKVEVREVKSVTGKGVQAVIGGEVVRVGKPSLFEKFSANSEISSLTQSLADSGRTVMIVQRGEYFLGVVGLMDQPRETAKAVIERLRKLGIARMVMLSGDHQKVASSVADELGLTEARGDLMPEDKVDAVRDLRANSRIAMVGDGVNDAPAMTQATVAVAMGAAGSDVALQTADVALMSDNLDALPFAVGLSRQARSIVKQNLYISLGMVAILIPATMFGLKMGLAVIGHEGSTLVVVFNALRLLVYKDKTI